MGRLRELSKILKGLRRRGLSDRTVKVCPRCGSPDIHLSSSFDVWLTPEQYVCRNCGYKGPITLELDITDLKPEKKEGDG